ncbi:LPXTG cell wall anchor domain-containing protein [Limosilactobacillus fermentum]|nr:LPXTG cell wall anchor domain-containing protein [Limosilactobacillus fermentum]
MTKYGDQITYSTADTIADLEKKGYVLVNNEFDQTGQAFGDSSNGHTYTVTYQANGKVVPVDENGKPIPGADQPTYPTDPSDPTKVLPVPVPAVPGYTTKTTIVTPSDPGANTTVTYEKVVDEAPVTPATPAKPTATPRAKQAPANQATLPQTGNEDDAPVAVAGGLLAGLMGLLGLLGFKKKQDD